MLLKVSLIIAILASIGTLVLSHLQVADKVKEVQDNLQTTQGNLTTARRELDTARKEKKKVSEEKDQLSKELAEAQSNLETATSKWKEQEARAVRFETNYNKASADLLRATRDLASWNALQIPIDQVHAKLADLRKAEEANAVLAEEKKVMARAVTDLKLRLKKYEKEGEAEEVVMEAMKGKILAVDPKWEFVVINLGSNHGAKERGELLVSRKGRLVSKIRISRVEADRSVANVLPEWTGPEKVEVEDVVLN
jgi:chromosome segregation ATPase